MSEVHAIPTVYNGIEFRSRLEAKWAVVFDRLGWEYEYEPIDLMGYIPDFVLPWRFGPTIVEIKPEMDFDSLRDHTAKIERSGWDGEAMILGGRTFTIDGLPVIGLLAERMEPEDNNGETWWWDPAPLVICSSCSTPSVYHMYGNYSQRSCRCMDYTNHFTYASNELRVAWKNATNAVKYRHGVR